MLRKFIDLALINGWISDLPKDLTAIHYTLTTASEDRKVPVLGKEVRVKAERSVLRDVALVVNSGCKWCCIVDTV